MHVVLPSESEVHSLQYGIISSHAKQNSFASLGNLEFPQDLQYPVLCTGSLAQEVQLAMRSEQEEQVVLLELRKFVAV